MNEYDLVVIGGGAAGFTAALSAKKFDRKANVAIIANEKDFYSRCSLPFVISGEIESFGKVTHSIEELCQNSGIECIVDTAEKIDPERNLIKTKTQVKLSYKSLIIATGSLAFIPKIEGVEKKGIFTLKTVKDAENILKFAKNVKKVIVIGGGAIGVEISAALRNLGLEVTLVELMSCLLPSCFSLDFSEIIHERLKENGIEVITRSSVEKIKGKKKVEGVTVGREKIPCEMVVISVGMKPNVELAKDAGIEVENNAIKINERMETSLPGIFAAGDCVSSKSLITEKPISSQLGTTAIRQGKVAGINALGGNEKLDGGVLNSIVLKIFDLEAGRTGMSEDEAKKEKFQIVTGKIKTSTKEDYFPGTKDLFVKLIFNQKNEKILGCEIIGGEGIAEKVDLIAFAIQKNSTIDDIRNLDYCYTPPIISANNALVLAAENAKRKLRRIKEKKMLKKKLWKGKLAFMKLRLFYHLFQF